MPQAKTREVVRAEYMRRQRAVAEQTAGLRQRLIESIDAAT